jgi:hypothetical protein
MRTETEHGPLEYETEECSLCGHERPGCNTERRGRATVCLVCREENPAIRYIGPSLPSRGDLVIHLIVAAIAPVLVTADAIAWFGTGSSELGSEDVALLVGVALFALVVGLAL